MSTVRRMSDEELPRVLELLAQSGGTARTASSWQHDGMTALVLGGAEDVQAVMPLARRKIHVSGGRNLAAGWLSSNQFASKMTWRRQTRSTAHAWADLLPEVDALLVMRRDEPGGPAAWYAQGGFADVLSIRCLYVDMDGPPEPALAPGSATAAAGRYQVKVVTPAEGQWQGRVWQEQMLAVYQDVHGTAGGVMPRHATFWEAALAHHYYRAHYQFQIIGLWSASADAAAPNLMGYAVVGWSGWHSKRPRMDILELATRQWDTAVAGELIRTTCQLAWSKSVRQVRAVVSAHDPYRGHLMRTGFADRWGYVLQAKWLHAQRYLDGVSAQLPKELGDFHLRLAAPGEVPLVAGRGTPHAPGGTINLQADSATLTRLLLDRTDITAALQDGSLLPAAALSDRDMARLSLAFPWTPWVFHMLDYI